MRMSAQTYPGLPISDLGEVLPEMAGSSCFSNSAEFFRGVPIPETLRELPLNSLESGAEAAGIVKSQASSGTRRVL